MRCPRRSLGSGKRSSHCQHPWVQVHARHVASESHMRSCQPGHDAGAARDVQHSLAWLKVRLLDEKKGPRTKDGGYQMLLVDLRGRTAELPSLLLIHGSIIWPAVAEGARIPSIHGS